jgi:hypothetical protein
METAPANVQGFQPEFHDRDSMPANFPADLLEMVVNPCGEFGGLPPSVERSAIDVQPLGDLGRAEVTGRNELRGMLGPEGLSEWLDI